LNHVKINYEKHNGTSMAAPVITVLAALTRYYYPKLTALQVKETILKSVVKVGHYVLLTNGKEKHDFRSALQHWWNCEYL
jgi:subtilisin family serine protease